MRVQFDRHVSSASDGDSTGSVLAMPLSEMGEQSAPEPHMAQEKTSKNYKKRCLLTLRQVGSSVSTQSDQGKLEF